MAVINAANQIVTEYSNQGFLLTLRQLYYQFVSRDLIENSAQAYKRLGGIVNDARLADYLGLSVFTIDFWTSRPRSSFRNRTTEST